MPPKSNEFTIFVLLLQNWYVEILGEIWQLKSTRAKN
jgi:hypothetical protein